jgi:DNA-directed RNA polymerase specialized sigma24 family protein
MKAAKRGGGVRPVPIAAEDEGPDIPLPALDPTASMVAGTAEARLRIERELGPEERAILAGLLAGRNYREIAEKLGKTPDGVRMAWNRAREKLVRRGVIEDARD